jgi:histone H3
MVGVEESAEIGERGRDSAAFLGTLAPDPAGQLHVLGHDGDALGVDGAEVGVLEEGGQVRLRGLLYGRDRVGLEAEIGPEVLRDLADEALEGEPADEELGALLVPADLAESNSTGPARDSSIRDSFDRPRAECLNT